MPHTDTSARALPAPPPSAALLAVVAWAKPVKTRRPGRTVAGIALLSVACALSLELHCPRVDLLHVGVAHGAVMVLPALLLAAIGVRILGE